jgi:hypothetical protein
MENVQGPYTLPAPNLYQIIVCYAKKRVTILVALVDGALEFLIYYFKDVMSVAVGVHFFMQHTIILCDCRRQSQDFCC